MSILLSFSTLLFGQDRFNLFLNDIDATARGIYDVTTAPLQWESDDYLSLLAVAGGTVFLFTQDETIDRFFRRNQSKRAKRVADLGTAYGEPITVVGLTAIIYSFGILAKNDWARETAVILTSSLVPAGAIQTISKITAGRARPYMALGSSEFRPFKQSEDFYSFLSGHTLVAASTSLVLARRINNPVVKTSLYMAGLTGAWSRMYLKNHFASDVFLGLALSYATVTAAITKHKIRNKKIRSPFENYTFYLSTNRVGVVFCF